MAEMESAPEERWQANRDTLLERNEHMFNNPLMSDIKFAFPNKQTIPAHKYVLAISSPVFFAMFYGDLAEKGETIDITDCDSEVFLQFLRFVYYDDVNFRDVNSAIQVWYLADKYDIPSLSRECVNFIEVSMDPLDAFDIIPHARRLNHHDLEKICWEVIDYNAQQIATADSFLEHRQEFLLPFVQRSSLCIDEVILFKALDRWAARRCDEAGMTVDGASKRSVLGEEVLKNVRFSLMSPQDFSCVVLTTAILFTTEVIDVFKQFSSVPIPGGLKFSILPRMKTNAPLHSFIMGSSSNDQLPRAMPKSGMMTIMVRKSIILCGVKIIADRRSSRVSACLSLFRRGKVIAKTKTKYFSVYKSSTQNKYGEINVYFNRPLRLSERTCYNIEAKTETLQRHKIFVWSESLKDSWSNPSGHKADVLKCSGLYTECIPFDACYKGEVIELLHKQCEESNDNDSAD